MGTKMLNFLCRGICQNLQNFHKLQRANIAYQFKVNRPVYYPDRGHEMQRISQQQQQTQLIAETKERKRLPKDFYYKILGISRHASTQQIKSNYYTLAKRFHPDVGSTPQEAKRFQEISNAYHILTDETKRLEYDQLGVIKDEQTFLNKIAMANKKPFDLPMAATKEELIQMAKGDPKLELTFLEAAHGLKKNIELRFLKCPTCNGKAPKLATRAEPELCRKCNGTGRLAKRTSTYTSLTDCDQCHGKRYLNRNECEICDNRGIVLESVKVVVPVPAGVKTGDIIAVENPKTKQLVNYHIEVQQSDYYQRVGNHLHTDKYLNISEAVLGGTFKVRGIYEDMDVKIEPGTESHTKIVLKGKGIKLRDGGFGDHIVTIKVRIPRQLSMKQRQLILALSKTEQPTFETANS